ncbi:hypothetical protein VTH82DRAFT_7762 [Thermothelomyces myriococcoides]
MPHRTNSGRGRSRARTSTGSLEDNYRSLSPETPPYSPRPPDRDYYSSQNADPYNFWGISDALHSSPGPYDGDDELLSPTAHYDPNRRLGDHQREQYRRSTSRAATNDTTSSPVRDTPPRASSANGETPGSPGPGWDMIPYDDPNRAPSPDVSSDSTLVIELPRPRLESGPSSAHHRRRRRERRPRTRSPSYTDYYYHSRSRSRAPSPSYADYSRQRSRSRPRSSSYTGYDYYPRSRSRTSGTPRMDSNDTFSSSPPWYPFASPNPDPSPRPSFSYQPAGYSQGAWAVGRSSSHRRRRNRDSRVWDGNGYYSGSSRSRTSSRSRRRRSGSEEMHHIPTSTGETYIYYTSDGNVHVDGPFASEFFEPPSPEYPGGRHFVNLDRRRWRRH